jgi:hypothetical protein
MATPKQKSSSSGSEHTCRWCEKSFQKESSLVAHVCPKKRRWTDRTLTHVRLAHQVYNRFYELTTQSHKPKSQEDFIRSPYYGDFVKFGRACVSNNYIETSAFADWLIENSVKLRDWCKDSVYNDFLRHYIKREPALRALERTIEYLVEWGEENNQPWNTYFANASTPRAVHDIRAGRVSPWVVYMSETGGVLMEKLSSEQWAMIWPIMDTDFWMPVFKNSPDQQTIQQLCKEANL